MSGEVWLGRVVFSKLVLSGLWLTVLRTLGVLGGVCCFGFGSREAQVEALLVSLSNDRVTAGLISCQIFLEGEMRKIKIPARAFFTK